MADEKFDLVVIGSGPGGYVGAIRAAQLGLKTAVVEKDPTFGGTCLNVGCIPSKALLQSSEYYSASKKEFDEHGIDFSGLKLNLDKMMKRKEKVVSDLTGGVKYLFDKNKITTFQGYGSFVDAHTIKVSSDKGDQTIKADKVMIATGSVPVELPHIKYDFDRIVSSTEALSFKEVPKHLCVIGGGVIGLELGSVWSRLGAEVTVVEFADRIIAGMDKQLSKDMLRILKKQGLNFKLSSKVTGAEVSGKTVKITYEDMKKGKEESFECDRVLVAVGRRAFADKLNLEAIGVNVDDRGRVPVNNHLQTNLPHIFAIGDVIAGPMLAHKAEEEGVAAVEFMATGYGHVNYETVPGVVYTWPEVASVGKTEEELKEAGIAYNSGMFPFSANGRAKAFGNTDGRVKILADAKTDRLLGVHIIGPNASELISEAVVAMEFGGSAEDLARSFHAHPTLAETMREAALAVDKRARQM